MDPHWKAQASLSMCDCPKCQAAARRIEAASLEGPAQAVVEGMSEIYKQMQGVKAAARRLRKTHPDLATKILRRLPPIDREITFLSMDIDQVLAPEMFHSVRRR